MLYDYLIKPLLLYSILKECTSAYWWTRPHTFLAEAVLAGLALN